MYDYSIPQITHRFACIHQDFGLNKTDCDLAIKLGTIDYFYVGYFYVYLFFLSNLTYIKRNGIFA